MGKKGAKGKSKKGKAAKEKGESGATQTNQCGATSNTLGDPMNEQQLLTPAVIPPFADESWWASFPTPFQYSFPGCSLEHTS
jgi:hypothetical protein